jgi:hypothetical protein
MASFHFPHPSLSAPAVGFDDQGTTIKRIMADKRVTMIKPVVGKVKSPSYSLPDNGFVYGIESKLDKEGAGEGEIVQFQD